jgi:2-polyprenyl-6-methoxyphenol hydroxylase-like FAD-dependent oxidoreductase
MNLYKPKYIIPQYKNVKDAKRVIIVGAGPAGIFAALQCIEQGLKPVILERGKDVKQRRRDLANINKQGLVNPESIIALARVGQVPTLMVSFIPAAPSAAM